MSICEVQRDIDAGFHKATFQRALQNVYFVISESAHLAKMSFGVYVIITYITSEIRVSKFCRNVKIREYYLNM